MRVVQHYNIVEDLAQAPSAMLALEVLQLCPSQWKALIFAIRGIDPVDSNLITFDIEDFIPRLPSQVAFLIQFTVMGKNIHSTIVDEGDSTYIMSIACWKAIDSPLLS